MGLNPSAPSRSIMADEPKSDRVTLEELMVSTLGDD
jgi:hypothetical protein